jgi:hypothetical protein
MSRRFWVHHAGETRHERTGRELSSKKLQPLVQRICRLDVLYVVVLEIDDIWI